MKVSVLHFISLLFKLLRWALVLIIGVFFVILFLLKGNYQDFRDIYHFGLEGKNNLTAAVAATQAKNWSEAASQTVLARNNFNVALERIETVRKNKLIAKLPFLEVQVNDLEYLFKTTEILSRSLERALPLAEKTEKIRQGATSGDLVNLKKQEKEQFLKLIYESEPELNGLKANLDIAIFNLDKLHRIGILWPVYGKIDEYKSQLETVSELMEKVIPLARILPALGGYPQESNFLILLQNNDELRPTGGFIGVFGLAKIKNGEIGYLATSDSYHLDMPAVGKWKSEPPVPIKKYLNVNNWYLRDSNWVPDWSLAAQKITEIFQGESAAIGQPAPNFSGVIAINPDFISNLISLVGTIKVQGENYTPENFQELLQYNVEIAYKDRDISSWDRKDIINELLAELQERLFNLEPAKLPRLISLLGQDVLEKNIQLYFKDPAIQSLAVDLGAGGEVKKTDKDYLLVVDANLAAFKSDAVLKKKINYTLTQKNKQTEAALNLTYRHEGDFDWRTTRYRSYTRVYVPFGSRLIGTFGLDEEKMDWTALDDPILDKTIFGFFFTVEPGTERQITIRYQLPERISEQIKEKDYELLVQKQSGRRTEEIHIEFNPERGKKKSWTRHLRIDQIFIP